MRKTNKSYTIEEIGKAFSNYFYGSGSDFFFPHPKLDNTSKKECREIVKIRYDEFLEILTKRKAKL